MMNDVHDKLVPSAVKAYTVDELIAVLKAAARSSPRGGATKVRIGDWEGNWSEDRSVETLGVAYDPCISRVMIYCDPYECWQ